jgi:hypothetical protein
VPGGVNDPHSALAEPSVDAIAAAKHSTDEGIGHARSIRRILVRMSGCPEDATLLVRVGGSLAAAREVEVKRHLDGCIENAIAVGGIGVGSES